MPGSSESTTAARGESEYRCVVSESSSGTPGASSTQTAPSDASSSVSTVWPWLASMSASPRRTLGRAAITLTSDTASRLLACANRHGQLLQRAAAHHGCSHTRTYTVRTEQALQVACV